jgi:hypothetical protein
MKGVAQMADEKSNEEKAAEIVAEAIRDRLTLPNSGERGQPDENVVEVLTGIYSELRRIADALEEANSWRASR